MSLKGGFWIQKHQRNLPLKPGKGMRTNLETPSSFKKSAIFFAVAIVASHFVDDVVDVSSRRQKALFSIGARVQKVAFSTLVYERCVA